MWNLESIIDSVIVSYGSNGVVRFPNRDAARGLMEAMQDLYGYDRSDYRILTMKDSPCHVVYWTCFGSLLDVEDLSTLKSDLCL